MLTATTATTARLLHIYPNTLFYIYIHAYNNNNTHSEDFFHPSLRNESVEWSRLIHSVTGYRQGRCYTWLQRNEPTVITSIRVKFRCRKVHAFCLLKKKSNEQLRINCCVKLYFTISSFSVLSYLFYSTMNQKL